MMAYYFTKSLQGELFQKFHDKIQWITDNETD